MTPIERAARALCRLDGHPETAMMDSRPLWQDYLPEVRAVLQAIREPSERMIMAHNEAEDFFDDHVRQAEVDWRAMIDAALTE